jgi:zinc transporter ZupT
MTESTFVTIGPAIAMLAGGTTGYLGCKDMPYVRIASQYFSAGLLISAVSNELVPLLHDGMPYVETSPSDFESYTGIISGLVIGLLIMYNIDRFTDSVYRRWTSSLYTTHRDTPRGSSDLLKTFFSVNVDATIDGLLIGLAYTASHNAGLFMAISTSIEMCFLGFSFGIDVANTRAKNIFSCVLVAAPPLVNFRLIVKD